MNYSDLWFTESILMLLEGKAFLGKSREFMGKIGRNDPCHCGSGKKYKKCHADIDRNVKQKITHPSPISHNLPQQGLPGTSQVFTIVPTYQDPLDKRNRDDDQGHEGEYEMIVTLSRPGYFIQSESNLTSSEFLEGDSHLAIRYPANPHANPTIVAVKMDIFFNGQKFSFEGIPNAQGFLSKVRGRFYAQNFIDAHRKGIAAVTPLLSNWSVQLDIPLFIFQVDLTEKTSESKRMTFTLPFRQTPLVDLPGEGLIPEFRGYTSLYREALNNHSPIYQFLCFFKIIESIRKRRGRLAEEARSNQESFFRPTEIFPKTSEELKPWLDAIYPVRPPEWDAMITTSLLLPDVAGKRFGGIIERSLNPVRIQIAHALFENTELGVSGDDPLSYETINKWLPILRCMVRRMLKNEFSKIFLVALPDP